MSETPETDVLQGRGRLVGVLACLAVLAQALLLPGMRAFGSGKVLTSLEYLAPLLLTSSALFAWAFSVRAAYALAFPSALSGLVRVALGAFAVAGLSISLPAFRTHVSFYVLAILQFTGTFACLAAGVGALSARARAAGHSGMRPIAIALLALAGASLSRFLANVCFFIASDALSEPTSHPRFIAWGTSLSSLAVALETAILVIAALSVAKVVPLSSTGVTSTERAQLSPLHVAVSVIGVVLAACFTLLSLGKSTHALATFFQIALGEMETSSLPTRIPGAARFLSVWGPILAVSLLVTRFREPAAALFALLCLSRGALDVPACYYFSMFAAFGVALTVGRRVPHGFGPPSTRATQQVAQARPHESSPPNHTLH